jgi:hypothetical protein
VSYERENSNSKPKCTNFERRRENFVQSGKNRSTDANADSIASTSVGRCKEVKPREEEERERRESV